MSIQLFTPKFRTQEVLLQIEECLDRGWTGLGFKTIEIENRWNDYTSHENSHFLSSNTVGLHLALEINKRIYKWNESSEVITTPLTFISSNHAILYSGLRPVFADVDEYLCLDPDSVKERITKNTKALIFVGLGGNTGQISKIKDICDENGITLILDAAHMAGTRLNGMHPGLLAQVAVYSFQAVKNLPTADSGMISFKDQELDAYCRKLSWLGINKDTYARTAAQGAYKWMYEVEELGYKYHGNSIMAAMALIGLKYLDQDNAYRRTLAKWYQDALKDKYNVSPVNNAPNCESSQHLFQVRVKNRDEVLLALNSSEVYPGVHYRDNTEYDLYSYAKGTCPRAAQFSNEVISLPMHMGVTQSDVCKVTDLILRYAR